MHNDFDMQISYYRFVQNRKDKINPVIVDKIITFRWNTVPIY